MKILFDATWWVDGPVSNRQVLREIIFAWCKDFPQDELHLAVPKKSIDSIRNDLPAQVLLHSTRMRQHALICLLEIPILANRISPDAIFNQNFPTLFGQKSAVFLHDILFETNPEWFTFLERIYLSVISRTIKRASLVITSTETEATRINFHHPTANANPVGLAPGTELINLIGSMPLLAKRHKTYHLAVGRLNTRKNLAYAMEISTRSGYVTPDSPLIIVGTPQGKFSETREFQIHQRSGSVIFTGHLPPEELVWLYKNATSLIFMSRGEGFGLPVVEAMHFGCPTIISDIDVFREVSGGNALFLPLNDIETAINALRTIRPTDLRMMAESGKKHVLKTYSWSKTVEEIRRTLKKDAKV